jgi:spore maturation protein CgeB
VRLVVLGLSLSSAWGNGHATTYRALLKAFAARGHEVTFLERDVPWYAAHRDLPEPGFCRLGLYRDLAALEREHGGEVAAADAVILGSYVPDGVAIGEWLLAVARGPVAFYDIDTPVTLAKLARGDTEYLAPDLIPRLGLYLSFTGGPVLQRLENEFGARRAHALYCSVDERLYRPLAVPVTHDLGYLGTYSADRQPKLESLLLGPARALPEARFIVAGPQYPATIAWEGNVDRIEHLPPGAHATFYAGQRFTLNITRADMVAAGYSPSVRLFEAAACGVPVISDWWEGLDTLLRPDAEILIADDAEAIIRILRDLPETCRTALAAAARARVLDHHTASVRARDLEGFLHEAMCHRLPGNAFRA